MSIYSIRRLKGLELVENRLDELKKYVSSCEKEKFVDEKVLTEKREMVSRLSELLSRL